MRVLPSEAEEPTGEQDGSLIELDESEGDEVCNKRFATCRQLMTHKTRKHGARTVLGLLTRTNERPWCTSRSVDRERRHCIMCITKLKKKEHVTSISPDSIIFLSHQKI